MRDWFNKLESRAKRLVFILGLISVIGTSGLAQVLTSYNRKIKSQTTMIQVLAAQVQTFHPKLYTGEVEIFRSKFFGLWKKSEGVYPVQIRYGHYYDEKENQTVSVYWVYVRSEGSTYIYHAIPYDGSYYFYDWSMDRQWIYNIEKE